MPFDGDDQQPREFLRSCPRLNSSVSELRFPTAESVEADAMPTETYAAALSTT